MQRVALGLELVYRHLQSNNEAYATKYGNFWLLSYEQANRVVQDIFVTLKSQHFPVETLPLVPRDTIPLNVVCMDSVATSDIRDWVILQDTMKLVDFYMVIFNAYENQVSHRLVERATFDPIRGETRMRTAIAYE